MPRPDPLHAVTFDPTHEFHMPAGLCMICKKRPAARAGTCEACESALSGAPARS